MHSTSMEEERLAAFKTAVKKYGAREDEALIRLGLYFTTNGDDPAKAGREMMHELLQAHNRPTAVLASGDILAAGALQALGEVGLSVPKDMSVIGFDNSIANLLTPPLTSIGRPLLEIGRSEASAYHGSLPFWP